MNRNQWQEEGIYVLSVGAQTPLGRNALRSAAAVRCGICAYREHPFLIDRHGEPMVVASADWLPEAASSVDRIVRLGADALVESIQGASSAFGQKPAPVIMALSSATLPAKESQAQVVQQISQELRRAGFPIEPFFMAEGNAVGAAAIQRASTLLRYGTIEAISVLGVDSQLGQENLRAIDKSGRLHSINNSWGFTPGEGAGAVVLTTGRVLERYNLEPLAQVAAVATAEESNLHGTKTVCIGNGLTRAMRGVLSESEKVSFSYCDLNGETYRADEFGFAICRTRVGFHDAGRFCTAAECWGDVGAASVPLQVTLATSAWCRGYALGSEKLCWSSSATLPLRGALRLTNTWQNGGEI